MKRYLIAITVIMVIGGAFWGTFHPNPVAETSQSVKVVTKTSQAQTMEHLLRLSGTTQASRTAILRAETSGRIMEIPITKGTKVSQGAELITLDLDDRVARLEEARARLVQKEQEYNSGAHLKAKALQSTNALAAQQADLAAARAALSRIEMEIKHTHITAPFSGVFEEKFVEVGGYVNVGDKLAHLVELNPLKVICHVPEKDAARLKPKTSVKIKIPARQETREGQITFIAQSADPKTRTFLVEIVLDNHDDQLADGLTCEVSLNLGTQMAHLISPGYFILNDDGVLGIKTVENQKVIFHPVTIVNSDKDGVWVKGLPEKIEIITLGSEFVLPDQDVQTQ